MARDLRLHVLVTSMARGDVFIADLAMQVLTKPLRTVGEIRYRQAVVGDCLGNRGVIRAMYTLATGAIEGERRIWGAGMRSPELILSRSIEVLELLLAALEDLRRQSVESRGGFASPGFAAFIAQLDELVDDAFLATARGHLAELRDRRIHVSARLGPGNRGVAYVLHRRPAATGRWRTAVKQTARRGQTLKVLLSDQNAMNTLAEVRAQAIAPAAAALTQSAGHMLAFFSLLRQELGFYLGCVNLHEDLGQTATPTCMPAPVGDALAAHSFRGLRDSALAIVGGKPVVGSDADAAAMPLAVITGANGGGKSTLLRAVGLAQVMMQAGMFVTADAFTAGLRSTVLTHFTREEDPSLERGKLADELDRLSALIDEATPDSLVLLNESFACTSEREAADIALQVTSALVDSGVRVWFVTHLQQYAATMRRDARWPVLFLQPELDVNGRRTFRITLAPAASDSHGADLYQKVFGAPLADARSDTVAR